MEECMKLHGCETGEAKITKGYNLPCKYVIHTVGSIWTDGGKSEAEQLANCYKNSLSLAKEYGIRSIAFPSLNDNDIFCPPFIILFQHSDMGKEIGILKIFGMYGTAADTSLTFYA